MYYRGASAAIVVYDITNKDSFNGAKSWVKELQRRGDPNVVIALAGNKSDLEHKRAVSLLLCDNTTREGVRETRGTTRVPRFLSGCACLLTSFAYKRMAESDVLSLSFVVKHTTVNVCGNVV